MTKHTKTVKIRGVDLTIRRVEFPVQTKSPAKAIKSIGGQTGANKMIDQAVGVDGWAERQNLSGAEVGLLVAEIWEHSKKRSA